MPSTTPYRIGEKLYESANSVIYRASEKQSGLSIILKTLNFAYPPPEKIAWFKREYELTRDLSETIEGVVKTYQLYTDHNRWAMALEDFGGESLTRLQLAGHLTLDQFLPFAIQIADLLAQVHHQGVIHKDLNPANMLLNLQTGEVRLIDFGLSTRLSRETPLFCDPEQLEGTPAYLSPEQTGRMNRTLDYRTDFYSLGASFYELLTGQPPFLASDLLELVHAHLARAPQPLTALRPDLPSALEAIILKLLAKNAEERYQSAYGLKADLEECLRQWQDYGRIERFPLGTQDFSEQLSLPQKLYGREAQIAALLAAFERVSEGRPELMLVTGYAGIGKSALVHEVYKPLTRRRGYFLAGKFEQFQRNIPYSAILQAFRGLLQQLLAESESALNLWRERLRSAFGSQGQVLCDVLPEIELIVGPQPPAPVLPPVEAQHRFNTVFQNFVSLFAAPEHPLVLFLDDLQWADSASLGLLEMLLTAAGSRALFIIGAYRDNEVGTDHPLTNALKDIEQAGAGLGRLALTPLSQADSAQFLADALCCSVERVLPLASLAWTKTGGNPFFLNEFLKSLYAEQLLLFVPPGPQEPSGRWEWDVTRIQARGISNNVVELLAGKVQQLPAATQHALQLAACLGSRFDLETLARVVAAPPEGERSASFEMAQALWPALTDGFLLPLGEGYQVAGLDVEGLTNALKIEYCFAHDRVQQAAYSLIAEADKEAVHLRIGRLLLESLPPDQQGERLFEIVNHFNLGRAALTEPTEREQLAELNLRAGRKAKAATAYEPAMAYLGAGLELLTPTCWETQYSLTVALFMEQAECAYLASRIDEAESLFALLLRNVRSRMERAEVYQLRVVFYNNIGKLPQAIEVGLEGLALFDVSLPQEPEALQAAIQAELGKIREHLESHTPDDILHAPRTQDSEVIEIMKFLINLAPPTYETDQNLFTLLALKLVTLSFEHGNTYVSAFGYAALALLWVASGNYSLGYAFSQLALQLNQTFKVAALEGKLNMIAATFILPWNRPLAEDLAVFKHGFQACVDAGDHVYANYILWCNALSRMVKEDEIDLLLADFEKYLAFARQTKNMILPTLEMEKHFLLTLQGKSRGPETLDTDTFSERDCWEELRTIHYGPGMSLYKALKLQLFYYAGDYSQALQAVAESEALLVYSPGILTFLIHHFYHGLTVAALYPTATDEEKALYDEVLAEKQTQLDSWAESCPETFRHKADLLAAEIARVSGRDLEAMKLYQRAVQGARQQGFVGTEGLAHELAARFYLSHQLEEEARTHLQEARYAYLRWGAEARVHALDTTYPELLFRATQGLVSKGSPLTTTPSSTTTGHTQRLDLASIMKASQTISSEIILTELLKKMMQLLIENGGAQKGTLLLENQGQWWVEAQGEVGQEVRVVHRSLSEAGLMIPPLLPLSLIYYVARTKEALVLEQAIRDGRFAHDPYILEYQPQSVLCEPILHHGKLTGLLYLENNLMPGAFTPERLEILQLLSGQATISLENAHLYAQLTEANQTLEQRVIERTTELAQRVEQLNLINRVGRYATAQLNRESLLAPLAESIRTAFDYYAVLILLVDADSREVRLSAASTAESVNLLEQGLSLQVGADDEGLIGHAVASGQPLVVEDVTSHPLYRVDKRLPRTRSELALPLRVGEQVLGVLDLESTELNAWRPSDVLVLQTLADQIAIALHNAELFQAAQVARAEAVSAYEMKGRFLSSVSHELRTPLNAIINFALLLDLEAATPQQSDLLKRIARAGEHLLGMINDILDLAKIDSGHVVLLPETVDMRLLAEDALSTATGLLHDKPVELRLEVSEPLPLLYADRTRVRQVLLNLLSNAAKFTERGHITLCVSPTLLRGVRGETPEQEGVLVSVEDTGRGMSPEEAPQVFEEFVQLEGGRQKGGTGLGLPISKRFIELHGGQMWVESTLGEGSTFYFTLPVTLPTPPEA